jgi:nucleotidyltransferase substrate binding protein (TIGR01987 family)
VENLNQDLILLNNALKTLNDVLALQEDPSLNHRPNVLLSIEDSIIKRFEYSYECFWKFLKKYLEKIHHVEEINSPKKVFRASVKVTLCTFEEGATLVDMADNRNETAHTYNITTSRAVLLNVPMYYEIMLLIANRIAKELSE